MHKPLEDELAATLRTVFSLRARRQDELEDYFHDAIVKALRQGKDINQWLGYVYRTVSRRIACGQEEREHLPLVEEIVPEEKPPDIGLMLDVQKAMAAVHPQGRVYLYEYFYEGCTLEEIANKYGVTNQTVSKSIQRGLGIMRGILED